MLGAKFKVVEVRRIMSSKRVERGATAESPEFKPGIYDWVPCEMQTIILRPVTGGSEENKKFWASTPSGSIELGVINQGAWKEFELDKEYYIDFTLADQ